MKTLTLTFDYLPDLDKVGGNARHAHWAPAHKDFQAEKQMWYGLIREQLIPPMPYFARAEAFIVFIFATDVRRDQDGLMIALKPLWDAMKKPGPNPKDYGWSILDDDDMDHLVVHIPTLFINPKLAPQTIVRLVELE